MQRSNWTREFLKRARLTNDPAGDLVADMRVAMECRKNVPSLFCSKREMEDYVRREGGCDKAIEACSDLWPRYRRFVDRHPWGFPADPVA
jgi:hypothetical protein